LSYVIKYNIIFIINAEKQEIPVFAIELDEKEHIEEEVVKERDRKKNDICRQS